MRLRPVQRAGRVHLPRMPGASGHVGASQPQTCPWGGEGSGAVGFCSVFFWVKKLGFEKMEHPASIGRISFGDFPLKASSIGPFFVRGFLSHVVSFGDEFSDFRNGSIWEDRKNTVFLSLSSHQDGLTLGFYVGMSSGKS